MHTLYLAVFVCVCDPCPFVPALLVMRSSARASAVPALVSPSSGASDVLHSFVFDCLGPDPLAAQARLVGSESSGECQSLHPLALQNWGAEAFAEVPERALTLIRERIRPYATLCEHPEWDCDT